MFWEWSCSIKLAIPSFSFADVLRFEKASQSDFKRIKKDRENKSAGYAVWQGRKAVSE